MYRALASVLFIVACGYQPAASVRSSVEVTAISTRVPRPEISACLTAELRLGLTATSHRPARELYRLEGELVDSTAEPGTLTRVGGEIGAVDQATTLAVRVRLVHRDGGVVWGPRLYHLRRRALEGSSPARSYASARQAMEWSCGALAARIIDDITFYLSAQRERLESGH